MLASLLLLATPALLLRAMPRTPPPRACAAGASSAEPLQLTEFREMLLSGLEAAPPASPAAAEASSAIQEIYEDKIARLEPAIWAPDFEGRAEAIIELSRGLDALEEAVKGPLLAGKQPTAADGLLYPSFVLFSAALPVHYGWKEWTSEALFYRRPQLHAWFELMAYQKKIKAPTVEEQVRALVSELSFEWAQPVPTLAYRGVPVEYD